MTEVVGERINQVEVCSTCCRRKVRQVSSPASKLPAPRIRIKLPALLLRILHTQPPAYGPWPHLASTPPIPPHHSTNHTTASTWESLLAQQRDYPPPLTPFFASPARPSNQFTGQFFTPQVAWSQNIGQAGSPIRSSNR